MHLLFLGIVKSCKEMILGWLKHTKKTDDCNSERMKVCSVLEKWGICWLKIINTNSGWVSENYLGFSRIMKWFSSCDIEKK